MHNYKHKAALIRILLSHGYDSAWISKSTATEVDLVLRQLLATRPIEMGMERYHTADWMLELKYTRLRKVAIYTGVLSFFLLIPILIMLN